MAHSIRNHTGADIYAAAHCQRKKKKKFFCNEWHFYSESTDQIGVVVTLEICVPAVHNSNLGRSTDYEDVSKSFRTESITK
jgi:hypothetical protein